MVAYLSVFVEQKQLLRSFLPAGADPERNATLTPTPASMSISMSSNTGDATETDTKTTSGYLKYGATSGWSNQVVSLEHAYVLCSMRQLYRSVADDLPSFQ